MFQIIQSGHAIVLEVRGDIDIANGIEFADLLGSARLAQSEHVVVSLAHCTYLDTTCLSALIAARKSLPAHLSIVVKPDSIPARLFAITNLDRIFTIYDSLDVALDTISA